MAAGTDDIVLGIDLGTSYCCAAVYLNGKTEIITNDYGSRLIPSYINFTENGRLFGDNAFNQIGRNPSNRIFDIKRLIGQRCDGIHFQYLSSLLPFRVLSIQNKPAVEVSHPDHADATERYLAEEILAMQMLYLKSQAENYLKTSIDKAVIGIPCSYNALQREAIRDAAKIAGLTVLRLHSDPGLASCAFVYKNPVSTRSPGVIVDIGGGHCNIAVVTLENQMACVEALNGEANLGGQDFTNRLLQYVQQDIQKNHKKTLVKEARALCRLQMACEKAKKVLSTSQKTIIQVDALPGDFDYQLSVSREVFEKINEDLFDEVVHVIDGTLREAGFGKQNIEQVILCGGSTRIPALQSRIQQFFDGKTLNHQINPDEAVAEGAALVGALRGHQRSASIKELLLLDVCPFSLGVETVGNCLATVIHRNKHFPVSTVEEFKPVSDRQGGYLIQLYEGESGVACQNKKLAQLLVLNQTSSVVDLSKCQITQFDDRKENSLHVTVSIEPDMQIKLHAMDSSSQQFGSAVVIGYSEEEIADMAQRAENLRNDESVSLRISHQKNQLEKTAFKLQSQADELSRAASHLLGWLESNQKCDDKELLQKQTEIGEVCRSAMTAISSLMHYSTNMSSPSSEVPPSPSFEYRTYPTESYTQ